MMSSVMRVEILNRISEITNDKKLNPKLKPKILRSGLRHP